jgi:hypothetical protein
LGAGSALAGGVALESDDAVDCEGIVLGGVESCAGWLGVMVLSWDGEAAGVCGIVVESVELCA